MSIRMARAMVTALTGIVLAAPGESQTFKVLHEFGGEPDGATPFGVPLVSAGELYGTTSNGGTFNYGTVFSLKLNTGEETVLYSFMGRLGPLSDGAFPEAGVTLDAGGNLYGTTSGLDGYGTVFEISASGGFSVLHNFTGPDGLAPYGRLVRDQAGNLYGTTSAGGPGGYGTVFQLDPAGDLTTLTAFAGGNDGGVPFDGLFLQYEKLFGVTNGAYVPGGPPYLGTIFQVEIAGPGTRRNLYHFGAQGPGALPVAGVVIDDAGNLYGTTLYTGTLFGGDGVVYKFNIASRQYTVLHTFAGGTADGSGPTGGLIRDASGAFYGTTIGGGTYNAGTVYKMDAAGDVTILHSFDGTDGEGPWAGLTLDSRGILYGVTEEGGQYGAGVVFAIKP